METLHSESEISKTGTESIEGDAWLSIDLVSWQVDSSVTWDADDTFFDPQFYVCIDVDGNTDGISPECVWTEIWDDKIELNNSWNISFDLPEDFEFINITIECWDNDESSDEWNDGNDACDLNTDDDYWRMYYQTNFSDFTSENVTGSGYGDQNSQGSKGDASSIWKFSLLIYPDSDSDGVADQFDDCNQTPIARKVLENGCWWMEGDIDDDGINNPEDGCNGLPGSCTLGPQYIVEGGYLEGHSWFHPDGQIVQLLRNDSRSSQYSSAYDYVFESDNHIASNLSYSVPYSFGYSPDGSFFLSLQQFTNGCCSKHVQLRAAVINETGFSNEVWFATFGSYIHDIEFLQTSLLMVFEDGVIAEIELELIQSFINGELNSGQSNLDRTVLFTIDDYKGNGKIDINPAQSKAIITYSNEDKGPSILYDVELDSFSDFPMEVSAWGNRHGWLSDRHYFINDDVVDVIQGTTQELDREWGYDQYHHNFPALMYPEDGNYLFINPINNEISTLIINCPHESCSTGSHRLIISPDGSRIIIGNWQNELRFSVGYLDSDQDNIPDYRDLCKFTTVGSEINDDGCSDEETDQDSDGIFDAIDICPSTANGVSIDESGCAQYQLDDDIDGVANDIDVCPNSPSGETVDLSGCSSSQVDIDEDGVYDSQDNCPSTPSNTTVDSTGCAPDDVVDLDSDGDGVRDSIDVCPNSATGIIVDQSGCEIEKQTDEESDATNGLSNQEIMICGGGGLLIFGFLVALFSTYAGDDNDNDNDDAWMYETIGGIGLTAESSEETDLELENIVAELERQRAQSEREINQLRQQQAQQSNASEIEAMQREMQALQQRVADSEQAKIQLKNEIEQVKIQHDESINMQDSVVGGDVVASGGQKIESQTNVTGADPEAIARIIFEAQEKERERLRKERNE